MNRTNTFVNILIRKPLLQRIYEHPLSCWEGGGGVGGRVGGGERGGAGGEWREEEEKGEKEEDSERFYVKMYTVALILMVSKSRFSDLHTASRM